MAAPPILNVHTPTSSFAVVHSIAEESLTALYDKLTRKVHVEYHGARVGPGWLKYDFQDTVWDLDDDADYTIFSWRLKTSAPTLSPSASLAASPAPASPNPNPHPNPNQNANAITDGPLSASPGTSPTMPGAAPPPAQPTLYLHDPAGALPPASAYRNGAFYLFRRAPRPHAHAHAHSRSPSVQSAAQSRRTAKSGKGGGKSVKSAKGAEAREPAVPEFKREFERFHAENGVRTVVGTIGPVHNVRMLLKQGYRHVYISRKFAVRHGFVPADAAPGHYGYGGLVNIGKWPISLGPTARGGGGAGKAAAAARTTTTHAVYLSEEEHFDVILGRTFHEARRIQTNPLDPTDVRCMDTGEQVECEVVVLRDGRGEIVTVT